MALNKTQKTAAPAAPTPAFEDTDAAPAAVADPAPAADPALAAAQGTTAIATASATSRAVVSHKGFKDFFKQFENNLPATDFGTLPRCVGTQGTIQAKMNGGKEIDLGKSVVLSLLSYRDEYVISPGSDAEEAKKLVAYSRDGKTIDATGQDVNEYLKNLIEVEGYTDASKKRYVYLTGILESATDDKSLVNSMVEISLSPQAVTDWEGYRLQTAVKISRGIKPEDGAERIKIDADKRSGNGRNWTTLLVKDAA